MTTLNTSRPRGMRDFYPEDFRLRENIFNAWRTAACSHGFEFVDAAPVEALALLERKSGEKISEQLYRFCRQERARPCIAGRVYTFTRPADVGAQAAVTFDPEVVRDCAVLPLRTHEPRSETGTLSMESGRYRRSLLRRRGRNIECCMHGAAQPWLFRR